MLYKLQRCTHSPHRQNYSIMITKLRWPLVIFLCVVLGAGYAIGAVTQQNDTAHPAVTNGWVDTRLYFGLGPADQPKKGMSETAWRDFLDKEVTPRFPDGLSVLDVYGQWRDNKDAKIERLRSKLLVIDHIDTPENRAKIDAIRDAWKRQTGDTSVLKVTIPADVSF